MILFIIQTRPGVVSPLFLNIVSRNLSWLLHTWSYRTWTQWVSCTELDLMASPIDTASNSLSLFTPVRLHILSTPYTEISPAQCSFNHLTLHSFMQFRKAFRVQVKGKNFQNTKVKQSKQATTDIKYLAESSLHFAFILSLNPSVTKQECIIFCRPLELQATFVHDKVKKYLYNTNG